MARNIIDTKLSTNGKSSTHIRTFDNSKDLQDVIRSYREGYAGHPWYLKFSEGEVKARLEHYAAQTDLSFLVATMNGKPDHEPKLIGFSVAYKSTTAEFPFLKPVLGDSNVFFGAELVVDESYRREGVATLMLNNRNINAMEKLEDGYILGRTKIENEPMRKLYAKLGYEDTGIRDPVYPSSTYWIKKVARE